ncbi:hypothetical protein AAHK20_01505 [Trinickia sp. YCB016]
METWSDSLDFGALSARYGSPIYVFCKSQLLGNFQDYVDFVGQAKNVAYPVKANPAFPLLRTLARLGSSADCASGAEIDLARSAGFPASAIFYNTPAFSTDIACAVLASGGSVVLNSENAARQLAKANPGYEASQLFLRWNPEMTPSAGHKLAKALAHGAPSSQFGVGARAAIDVLSETTLRIGGIHAHVGSRVADLDVFAAYIEKFHAFVDEIHARTHHSISTINLGGGLAVAFNERDNVPSIKAFSSRLAPLLRSDTAYVVEPGNSLVGNCIGLLTRVVQMGSTRVGRYAIVDAGSNELIKVTLPALPLQIVDARHACLPTDGNDLVAGPMCFAGDVLLPSTSLAGVREGDVLFIQHCGSYCYALANHFNGRYSPAMVALEVDGRIECCNTPEAVWSDSVRSTYRWETDHPRFAVAQRMTAVAGGFPPGVEVVRAECVSENTCEFSLKLGNGRLGTTDLMAILVRLTQACVSYLHAVSHEIEFRHLALDTGFAANPIERDVSCWIALSPWQGGEALVRFGMGSLLSGHGQIGVPNE